MIRSSALARFNYTLKSSLCLQNPIDKVGSQLQLNIHLANAYMSPLSTLTGLTRPGFPIPST